MQLSGCPQVFRGKWDPPKPFYFPTLQCSCFNHFLLSSSLVVQNPSWLMTEFTTSLRKYNKQWKPHTAFHPTAATISMIYPLPSRSWVSSQALLGWLSASTLTHPLSFLLTIHRVDKGVHDKFRDPQESRINR